MSPSNSSNEEENSSGIPIPSSSDDLDRLVDILSNKMVDGIAEKIKQNLGDVIQDRMSV